MHWKILHPVSAVAGIVLTVVLSSFLPERVATHFDITGQPNGWSSNQANTILFCGLFLFLYVLFSGITLLLRKIPVSLINMPNREYWFAAERRESTVIKVGAFLAEFGFFVNIFIVGILLMTFYANRVTVAIPSVVLFAWFSVFIAFVVGWVIHLYRAFRLPK